jgi:Ca2+-binding RTX toxin-like protein
MRTTTILIALMSVMVVVFGSVALAKVLTGDDKDNRLVGTQNNDTIKGKGGDDLIRGMQGDDTLIPGSGEDKVFGGPGNDFFRAVDRNQDLIVCGHGIHDRVRANPGDVVIGHEGGCEKVIREGIRVH